MMRHVVWVCMAVSAFGLPVCGQGVATTQPSDKELRAVEAALEETMERAIVARLAAERKLLLEEIVQKANKPEQLVTARKVLADRKGGVAELLEDAWAGLAAVDEDVAKGRQLMAQKKFEDAATALALEIKTEDTSTGAARALLYARALDGAKINKEAAEMYAWVVRNTPRRVSFAVQALRDLAELYRRTDRPLGEYYAYAWLGRHYGPSLSKADFEQVAKRVVELERTWGDPLGAAGYFMGDSRRRLEEQDVGKETQDRQKKIVKILDEMIAMESLPDLSSELRRRGGEGDGPTPVVHPLKRQGGIDPEWKTAPPSPAVASHLRVGDPRRPEDLNEAPPMIESAEWNKLPPETRIKLKNVIKQMTSQRYGDTIRDYRRVVAEGK